MSHLIKLMQPAGYFQLCAPADFEPYILILVAKLISISYVRCVTSGAHEPPKALKVR